MSAKLVQWLISMSCSLSTGNDFCYILSTRTAIEWAFGYESFFPLEISHQSLSRWPGIDRLPAQCESLHAGASYWLLCAGDSASVPVSNWLSLDLIYISRKYFSNHSMARFCQSTIVSLLMVQWWLFNTHIKDAFTSLNVAQTFSGRAQNFWM